jgi:SAM-dependent methyltransferase
MSPAENAAGIARRLYPEIGAAGFSRVDGTVEFYQRVNALLAPDMTVLDFGAGRGAWADDPVEYRRALRDLRGKAARVIGADVDPVVRDNPLVDETAVIGDGMPLPWSDESFDLVVSDFTFEHVRDPEWAAHELSRVLRPGGWICARTPNRWGYIGVAARLVPNRLHVAALRRLQPHKQDVDTFPTAYRLNSLKQIERLFPDEAFDNCSYTMDNEPAYSGNSVPAWRAMKLVFRVTPERLRSMLYVFLRKRRSISQ